MIDHHPHVVPNLYDIFPHKKDILKIVSVFAYTMKVNGIQKHWKESHTEVWNDMKVSK